MKNKTDIEEIIERYWNAETSLEEEKFLRESFNSGAVPENLQHLKEQFSWSGIQKTENISPDFERELLAKIKNTPGRSIVNLQFIARMAAVLIVFLGIIAIYTNTREKEPQNLAMVDTFNNPEQAYIETKKTLLLVSQKMNNGNKHLNKLSTFHKTNERIFKQDKKQKQ